MPGLFGCLRTGWTPQNILKPSLLANLSRAGGAMPALQLSALDCEPPPFVAQIHAELVGRIVCVQTKGGAHRGLAEMSY